MEKTFRIIFIFPNVGHHNCNCRFRHLHEKDYDAIDKNAKVSKTFVKSVIQVMSSEE